MTKLIKVLANLKYGSRKEIKNAIKRGIVTVNGEVVKSDKVEVSETDEIVLFGQEVFHKEFVYLLLNKPSGYLSTTKGSYSVMELIDYPYLRYDLSLCGRLDKDTEGLVILTNDGDVVHQIITPKKNVYKKYYVELKSELKDFSALEKGIDILDGKDKVYHTKPAIVEKLSDKACYISIKEGKFHQIKRMVKYFGNEVTYLKRVSIGGVQLEDLDLGEYKSIEKQDLLEAIKKAS